MQVPVEQPLPHAKPPLTSGTAARSSSEDHIQGEGEKPPKLKAEVSVSNMKAVRTEEMTPKRPERRKKIKTTLIIQSIHKPGLDGKENVNSPGGCGSDTFHKDLDEAPGFQNESSVHSVSGGQTPVSNSRLLHIINTDKSTTSLQGSSTIHDNVIEPTVARKSPSISLFQRGSHLVSSVRNSLRGMGRKKPLFYDDAVPARGTGSQAISSNDSGINDLSIKDRGERGQVIPGPGRAKTSCNDSQDSGLGEESDFDPHSSSSLVRTPTPITVSITQASSLRKISSSSSNGISGGIAKKHVIIREPSLSALPSARRLRWTHRLETVRIYPRAARLPSTESTGSVSTIWDDLYQLAGAEVMRSIPVCDEFTVRMMFNPDRTGAREGVQDLNSVDGIARLVFTVYKVVFFPWIKRDQTRHLAVILHGVQHFLIVIVDTASDLDMDDRLRFARICGDLLKDSEMTRYKDLKQILDRTRTVYIDLWCAMLCLPDLSPLESPSLVEIRARLRQRQISAIQEDDE